MTVMKKAPSWLTKTPLIFFMPSYSYTNIKFVTKSLCCTFLDSNLSDEEKERFARHEASPDGSRNPSRKLDSLRLGLRCDRVDFHGRGCQSTNTGDAHGFGRHGANARAIRHFPVQHFRAGKHA